MTTRLNELALEMGLLADRLLGLSPRSITRRDMDDAVVLLRKGEKKLLKEVADKRPRF